MRIRRTRGETALPPDLALALVCRQQAGRLSPLPLARAAVAEWSGLQVLKALSRCLLTLWLFEKIVVLV